ncbi:hypothetical protein GCM10007874_56250 [Labrys miyagiensis]|uniref:DUF3592 domain-containing protein n=2 Tax=Labrys miyagiensis TaxID=346912 RepID=A0ABQ6CS22_9HYPH|nr:hypothetical protein GCM10007874_56250 [Labrys miyagiensis]
MTIPKDYFLSKNYTFTDAEITDIICAKNNGAEYKFTVNGSTYSGRDWIDKPKCTSLEPGDNILVWYSVDKPNFNTLYQPQSDAMQGDLIFGLLASLFLGAAFSWLFRKRSQ